MNRNVRVDNNRNIDSNFITDPSRLMINGPINIVRLEGMVNGIKKIIYLFMDIHIDVSDQTQCQNIFSQDIHKYFINTFTQLNNQQQMYDFFLEVYPSELHNNSVSKYSIVEQKLRYIDEVSKIFSKIFNYDSKKDRVMVNKMFKRVRFHYLDIRDYYEESAIEMSEETVSLADQFMANDMISVSKLKNIIKLLRQVRDHIAEVVNILENPPKISELIDKRPIITDMGSFNQDIYKDRESLRYLARKISYIYKHLNVKDKINKLLIDSIDNFKSLIRNYNKMIKKFNSYVDLLVKSRNRFVKTPKSSYLYGYGIDSYTEREMIVDIVNSVNKAHDEGFIEYFARFTDVYFLRRFLDKDYITNAIVYSGSFHSFSYIHFLINEFDFKITHTSYSTDTNMSSLTKSIKGIKLMETKKFFSPPIFYQCSEISDFPENLS